MFDTVLNTPPPLYLLLTINIKDIPTNSPHLRGPSHSLALSFSWLSLLVALTCAINLSIYFNIKFWFYSLISIFLDVFKISS